MFPKFKNVFQVYRTLTIPVPLSQTSGWISSPSAIFFYRIPITEIEMLKIKK